MGDANGGSRGTTSSTKRTLANGFEYQYPSKTSSKQFYKRVNLAAVDLIA